MREGRMVRKRTVREVMLFEPFTIRTMTLPNRLVLPAMVTRLSGEDGVRLRVSDNGRGLSQEDLAKARSFGIRGLHERAGTVDGWVDLSSGPGGTTLILSVPLDGSDYDPALEDEVDDRGHDPSAWASL